MVKVAMSFLLLFFIVYNISAQDFFASQRQNWLQKAEQLKPQQTETVKQPVSLVTLVKDTAAFQDWKAVNSMPVDSLYQSSFKTKSGIVADFGEHVTGYYTFTVK